MKMGLELNNLYHKIKPNQTKPNQNRQYFIDEVLLNILTIQLYKYIQMQGNTKQ